MDNNNESKFNDIIDDQMDERDEYIREYNILFEDTQDFSNIVEELNHKNGQVKRERN